FPVSDRVAQILGLTRRPCVALAAVGRNDPVFAVAAAGIAAEINERDVLVGLVDPARRSLSRDAERLAGHHGVILVRPNVELLNLVPVLRLVNGAAGVAEPRWGVELE